MIVAAPAHSRPFFWLMLLALVFGGLNVVKPLHVDDTAYLSDARQIAAHPLDPYGSWIMWWQQPYPANSILAPPVVPYALALGVWLFGDNPVAWKLLLMPWALLLAYAVFSLARRFAAGMEWPLTILTILSPALWPSFNCMLDVPALGLALISIELFFRACEQTSFFKAACAGLIVGIGFETKYTACVAVAAIALAAVLWRRWALGIIAVLVAAHVFCAWEFVTAVLYGRSHFLTSLRGGVAPEANRLLALLRALVLTKGPHISWLLSLLGGVTPALLLLGLATFGLRRRWLVLTAMLFFGCVLAIGLLQTHFEGSIVPSARFFGLQETPPLKFELADVFFAIFGGALFLVTGFVGCSLFRNSSGNSRREILFLIGWLGLEIAAYFPLTPFGAVRRLLGIIFVMTLLLGRSAAINGHGAIRRGTVRAIVIFGVLLGAALFALDFRSAEAQKEGVEQAAEWIRSQPAGGQIWYAGHWGFQYYAEYNGMKPVIPAYEDPNSKFPPSHLEQGDWIVIPDETIDQQTFVLDPSWEVYRFTIDDPLPWSTLEAFYGGTVPVRHLEGPRLQVRIYQVREPFCPQPIPEPAPSK